MSPAHASVVVADTDQVVHSLPMVRVNHIRCHVQVLKRNIHVILVYFNQPLKGIGHSPSSSQQLNICAVNTLLILSSVSNSQTLSSSLSSSLFSSLLSYLLSKLSLKQAHKLSFILSFKLFYKLSYKLFQALIQ